MSVFLIGYRGSGKTTVGRKLAARLGWGFIDADEQIVQETGKTIRAIFADQGEQGFRDVESRVIEKLAALTDHVMSLGGGAVLREINRQRIAKPGASVIYLHCEPAVLADRIARDQSTADNRPALTPLGGSIDEVRQLLAIREPIYRSMMTASLDVTHLTPDESVERLAQLI